MALVHTAVVTLGAVEMFLELVLLEVVVQVAFLCALEGTVRALVRLFASVAANVSGEVTFLDTLIIAVWTFKWFVSRVGP